MDHQSFPGLIVFVMKTAFSTVLAAMMKIAWYWRAISAVTFWWVIAAIAPLAFLLAFMILMLAGAC